MDLTLIITLGILLGCIFGLSWFAGSDAPYVPTKMARIRKILKFAGVKSGKKFYELGSGDGRVVIEAAKLGATSYGIEQSWIRVWLSRWKTWRQNRDASQNCQFYHGDIFKLFQNNRHPELVSGSIKTADVVFIFLLPKGVEKLEPILKRSLKKGARVITQTFHFKSWKPYKKFLITDRNKPNTLLGRKKYEGDFRIYKV